MVVKQVDRLYGRKYTHNNPLDPSWGTWEFSLGERMVYNNLSRFRHIINILLQFQQYSLKKRENLINTSNRALIGTSMVLYELLESEFHVGNS